MTEIYIIDAEWPVCDNCEFWHQEEKPEWGRCKERPAQGFLVGREIKWLFPKMHLTEGCGQFVRRLMGRTTIQVEGPTDAEGI